LASIRAGVEGALAPGGSLTIAKAGIAIGTTMPASSIPKWVIRRVNGALFKIVSPLVIPAF
jgi:hypothetical protein